MSERFGTESWSVLVPEGWQARHDPECATLVADPAIGALQISAAFKDDVVDDSDLRDFAAKHLDAGTDPEVIQAGDFVGFSIGYQVEATAWREWYLRHGRTALFVTYNCDVDARGVEDAAVDAALVSLLASPRSRA
jgi:hypothetical protein